LLQSRQATPAKQVYYLSIEFLLGRLTDMYLINLGIRDIAAAAFFDLGIDLGAGSEIAAKFEGLGLLLKKVNAPERIGVCFDTCHAFAAGYQLQSPDGWEAAIAEFDRLIGISFLKCFHLNDSMGKAGSGLDRHQHIGAGEIGLPGFEYLVNHLQLSKLPGILETPEQDEGDDLRNLSTLRRLMRKAGES
jgi:deoxyribonuclease-4